MRSASIVDMPADLLAEGLQFVLQLALKQHFLRLLVAMAAQVVQDVEDVISLTAN